MSNINIILEGKWKNQKIKECPSYLYLPDINHGYNMTKNYISSYTVIDENNKEQYSFLKGALGVALLGGIGAIAGIKGKKKKEYLIAVEWKDGQRSLLYIDEDLYKTFIRSMF